MRNAILVLALTLAPAVVAAQAETGAQADARAQTAITARRGDPPRIPEEFSADTRARLTAMLDIARRKNLPAEPMHDRIAEGQAKGAAESEIVAASSNTLAQLELSQLALVRAGRERPSDAEVSRGAQLLARGASSAQLTALAGREPAERRLDVALEVLLDLTAQGMPVDRAFAAVETAGGAVGARIGVGLGAGITRKP
ncbi:MAG TPA: hypothetical protein VLB00_01065 [Gemmatimonadales bacterium]|nr:hypothetical protein [Gemmatimonadales bacterium]